MRSVAETGGGTADDLYSVRPSGAALARLTRTGRIDEFDPRYFAGGILFSRGESGEEASAYADIYTMRRNGRKARSLVAGAGSAYVEDVTPDGHLLLFRRDQGLWVKRIGPGKARKLSDLPDGSQTNAVFSSDGAQVAAFIEAEGRSSSPRSASPTARPASSRKGSNRPKPTRSGTASTSARSSPGSRAARRRQALAMRRHPPRRRRYNRRMGEPAIGSTLGGYRVDALIARGGMGVVYRATHLALDRPVALKVIARHLADDPAFRERFLTRVAPRRPPRPPQRRPGLRRARRGGELFVAMRLVEGGDLKRRIAAEGPLPPAEAVELLGQVADALDAAHAAGIVHRDVKPHNILLDGSGRAYLTDFGLAKALGDSGVLSGASIAGTVEYMSPEQWQGAASARRPTSTRSAASSTRR